MGGRIPPALEAKPDVPVEYHEYLNAFYVLSRSRRVGMDTWSIPLSEIEVYCRLFDVIDIDLFVSVMVELDIIYMGYVREDK